MNFSLLKQLSSCVFVALLIIATAHADVKADVKNATEAYLSAHKKNMHPLPDDMVNVAQAMPNVVLDIKYATDNNFTGKTVYTQPACYLRRAVVDALKKVQQELSQQGLGLKIWDGYRPHDVQQIFWNLVPDPRYVGDPAKCSRHNRGTAVDLALISVATGKELVMPSAFDDFSEKAHRNYAAMAPEAAKNCRLLEDAMTKQGFTGMTTEWWHFNFKDCDTYPALNISFEDLAKMPQV